MKTAEAEGATVKATLLVGGEPSTALVASAVARSADLVVLGAVHDRSLSDRLLGTVTSEVTKRATCDVLIVRPVEDTGELEVPEDAAQL